MKPAPMIVFSGLVCLVCSTACSAEPDRAEDVIWLEAEQFDTIGGWSNDTQFVDLMGSPYLLATGVGRPVDDAVTSVRIRKPGKYRLWCRCKDWLPSHAPGRFEVWVNGKASAVTFGRAKQDAWQWVDGGTFDLPAATVELVLHDLTGWWGRCDAVVLAPETFRPANQPKQLAAERVEYRGITAEIKATGRYGLVVVGGGPSGLGAAVAAARHGCKVALIQDRPVLGGNSSSEIEVPPMGYIGSPPDTVNITGLAEEFFPTQGWENQADSKKLETIVRAEPNISLFLNTRATGVEMATPQRIESVVALNVHDGRRLRFAAPLFVDCTGHGWIGYYAGAEYRMGQEARNEFGESLAPEKAGTRTMGNSLYKAGFRTRAEAVPFECPDWAYQWTKNEDFEPRGSHRRIKTIERPANFDAPSRGKGRNPGDDINGRIVHSWWIEYGGMFNTIRDAEKIRDELFRITIGMWNYAKNHNPKTVRRNINRELVWLNYVMGVRESRRLMGDYVMSQQDYDKRIVHHDTVAFTDWGPDIHHPEGFWVKGNDCIHVYQGRRTSIPYRTLYSKNIDNLFMAGRCHSATHVGLGGTRVMRPMCMTGQAAGTAAAIATAHHTTPRGVYEKHITEVQQTLLKDGCYLLGVRNRDKNDLARSAKATASSFSKGMTPGKAINGFNRVVKEDGNAWAPAHDSGGPHWLTLTLPRATQINTVHVTFENTGRGFTVEARLGNAWQVVADATQNTARRRVLHIDTIRTDAIRVRTVTPSSQFAICEVRLYHE